MNTRSQTLRLTISKLDEANKLSHFERKEYKMKTVYVNHVYNREMTEVNLGTDAQWWATHFSAMELDEDGISAILPLGEFKERFKNAKLCVGEKLNFEIHMNVLKRSIVTDRETGTYTERRLPRVAVANCYFKRKYSNRGTKIVFGIQLESELDTKIKLKTYESYASIKGLREFIFEVFDLQSACFMTN